MSGLGLAVLVAACDSPEERVREYLADAQRLFDTADYVRAKLQVQNVLKIDQADIAAWSLLARIAIRQERWPEAHRALLRIVDLDPADEPARLELASLYLRGGSIDLAAAQIDELAKHIALSANAHALRAAIRIAENDLAGAEEAARAGLALQPHHANSMLALASGRLRAGDVAGGLKLLTDGAAANPQHSALAMKLVGTLVDQGDLRGALAAGERALRQLPDDLWLRQQLADLQVRAGDIDGAERGLRAFVEAKPAQRQPKVILVQFLREHRGVEAAERALAGIAESDGLATWGLALGELYETSGSVAQAEATYRALLQADAPGATRVAAHNRLAMLALQRRDVDLARQAVRAALEILPADRDALILRARLALADRRPADAIADLRAALRQDSGAALAYLLAGRAHASDGAEALAIEAYDQAIVNGLDAADAHVELATLLLRRGHLDRAERVIVEGRRHFSDDAALGRLNLKLLAAKGEWGPALSALEAAPDLVPDPAQAQQLRAVALARQGQSADGLAAFGKAILQQPRALRPVLAMIRVYQDLGQSAQALAYLEQLAAAHPERLPLRMGIAQLHMGAQRWEPAIAAFREALRLHPDLPVAHVAIAFALEQQGKVADARATLVRARAAIGDKEPLLQALAGLEQRHGDVDRAIAIYDSIVAGNPESLVAANNLASLLADHRDDTESLRRAGELAARLADSDVPQFLDTRAWVSHKLGNSQDALALVERAIARAPEPIFFLHKGEIALALGLNADASASFRTALELSNGQGPAADEARRRLRRLDEVAKDKVDL